MKRVWALIGAACAGGVAVFLLDPASGKRRRATLHDRALRLSRSTGEALLRRARRTAHEARGLGWRVARLWAGPVTDEVLAERVRAQVGHAVAHGGTIEVQSRDGRVTLSGRVACGEVRRLLRRVSRIPGVAEVVNELEAWPKPCDETRASETA